MESELCYLNNGILLLSLHAVYNMVFIYRQKITFVSNLY